MSAKEYMVLLYLDGFHQAEELRTVDVGSDHSLANALQEMVRAKQGTNRVSDREYSRYVIHVHSAGSGRALWARCWLTSTGRAQVKR
jgi:hypothetical protein